MTITTSPPGARRSDVPTEGRGTTPTRAHPNVVLALVLMGALATVWLWWDNTPTIHGLGDWLTNAGRVSGLLAGYGVVVPAATAANIDIVSGATYTSTGYVQSLQSGLDQL